MSKKISWAEAIEMASEILRKNESARDHFESSQDQADAMKELLQEAINGATGTWTIAEDFTPFWQIIVPDHWVKRAKRLLEQTNGL